MAMPTRSAIDRVTQSFQVVLNPVLKKLEVENPDAVHILRRAFAKADQVSNVSPILTRHSGPSCYVETSFDFVSQ